MNLTPLFEASLWVQMHVAAAVLAIVLGAGQFIGRKGTMPHRLIGWFWVVMLAALCITSFFIPGSFFIGPISAFHALSVYTLWSLWMGARAARRGDVESHRSYMAWLYGLSVLISAAVAVLGGGVLSEVFRLS
ncbi:MAG: DUF2306 domain-containing protein [Beijerinckiaceae bacterium]